MDVKKEEELEDKIEDGRQELRWKITIDDPFYFRDLIQRRKVYLLVSNKSRSRT